MVEVAAALLKDSTNPHWGYELSKTSGVPLGVLYPVLSRMLNAGWLTDGWEDPAAAKGARPPRRYYRVTSEGEQALSEVLAEARTDTRFSGLIVLAGRLA